MIKEVSGEVVQVKVCDIKGFRHQHNEGKIVGYLKPTSKLQLIFHKVCTCNLQKDKSSSQNGYIHKLLRFLYFCLTKSILIYLAGVTFRIVIKSCESIECFDPTGGSGRVWIGLQLSEESREGGGPCRNGGGWEGLLERGWGAYQYLLLSDFLPF